MENANHLTGRFAVVTGGSRGTGAAISKRLAAAGATVMVNYARDSVSAEALIAQIKACGGVAWAVKGDLSKPEEVEQVFASIGERHSRIDILVNNAAVFGHTALEHLTPEEFHRLFDLNVMGVLLATKAAAAMMGPDGGSVINIGALSGQMPAAGIAAYSASKGALNSLTIALSKELGPRHIRVNALIPGMTQTEGLEGGASMVPTFAEQAIKATPLGRIGQPDDIAKMAVLLTSDDAYWVTGQLINMAGGLTY